ncbi:MAG: hypothetical protein JXQ75_15870 [Phycisphaerae bacterium]|nr:hypothetical protein [Phycisphaerae bacterium]
MTEEETRRSSDRSERTTLDYAGVGEATTPKLPEPLLRRAWWLILVSILMLAGTMLGRGGLFMLSAIAGIVPASVVLIMCSVAVYRDMNR